MRIVWSGVGVLLVSTYVWAQPSAQNPTPPAQDLTQISEIERLREAVPILQRERERLEAEISVYRAYIRKLEERIKELDKPPKESK